MKDLLILGAGVHACEMVEIIDRINMKKESYILRGFISKNADKAELFGYPVYSVEELEGQFSHAALVPDNTFDLEFKQIYRERMISLIDPSCFISRTAQIGRGCVLYPGCFVGLNAVLEDFVFSLSYSIINHDDVVGEGSILTSGVRIAGNVSIGRQVYLGQGCTIKQMLNIGEKSVIGTGAVVVKDVVPGSVMVGNPAHILNRSKS